MKKILLTALVCAPFMLMAQAKPATTTTPPAKDPNQKTMSYTPEAIYSELIISENANKTTNIRFDFGRDVMDLLTDKDLIAHLTELRTMLFTTVADALNYCISKGWKLVTTYQINTSNIHETRLVLEKRITKKPGMEPAGGMQRPNSGQPPVRPTDSERQPADRQPADRGKEKE